MTPIKAIETSTAHDLTIVLSLPRFGDGSMALVLQSPLSVAPAVVPRLRLYCLVPILQPE